MNFLDNTPNQTSNFKTKIGLKQIMNHEEHMMTIIKLGFTTSMIRSGLCDYSDTYILVKGIITIEN